MSEATAKLIETAAAVVAFGLSQADVDRLDDHRLAQGMSAIRAHKAELQRHELWLAAAVARRSDYTLRYEGLARKNGFPTPATFIQSLTGTSVEESTRLARLGAMIVEAEQAAEPLPDGTGGSGGLAISTAATSGGLNLDCADAIRRGLGVPDEAVTAQQLRGEAEKLIAHATSATILGTVTPEALVKLARQARNQLDAEAIDRGQKHRAQQRYVHTWHRDGFFGGSWRLTGEDGGIEINTALKLLLANRTGGPRFPNADANGDPIMTAAGDAVSERAVQDTRTAEQITADGFAQIFHNGLTANPGIVPGAARAAVRVIVTEKVLTDAATASPTERTGTALLEDGLTPITLSKLEEYLCEGGTVRVGFSNHSGNDDRIDVGREHRLFTPRQRTALGVRDGGCRYPSCSKPPSWCETHHINYWGRDAGATDTDNGILLCRYHHMLIHDGQWAIIRDHGTCWLKPPPNIDPDQRLIEMPSKNPLITATRRGLPETRVRSRPPNEPGNYEGQASRPASTQRR